jgi:hypothetical protein
MSREVGVSLAMKYKSDLPHAQLCRFQNARMDSKLEATPVSSKTWRMEDGKGERGGKAANLLD